MSQTTIIDSLTIRKIIKKRRYQPPKKGCKTIKPLFMLEDLFNVVIGIVICALVLIGIRIIIWLGDVLF